MHHEHTRCWNIDNIHCSAVRNTAVRHSSIISLSRRIMPLLRQSPPRLSMHGVQAARALLVKQRPGSCGVAWSSAQVSICPEALSDIRNSTVYIKCCIHAYMQRQVALQHARVQHELRRDVAKTRVCVRIPSLMAGRHGEAHRTEPHVARSAASRTMQTMYHTQFRCSNGSVRCVRFWRCLLEC